MINNNMKCSGRFLAAPCWPAAHGQPLSAPTGKMGEGAMARPHRVARGDGRREPAGHNDGHTRPAEHEKRD